MSNGIIEHLFPVHENKTLKWLRIIWVKSFFSLQPLDKVCDYFGVKIAMYFAWIGHYTGSLIYPAIAYSTFWVNIYINIIIGEVMLSNSSYYLIYISYQIVWIWKEIGSMDGRSMVCCIGLYECYLADGILGNMETILC